MEKRQTGMSSQLKLTLAKDPKMPASTKPPTTEKKASSSGSAVSMMGGVKSSPQLVSPGISKATAALTQTHLFTKILSAVPQIRLASGKVHRSPSANLPLSKPSPSGHMKPSAQVGLSPPLHTSNTKQPVSYTKLQPSSHTNPPPSSHAKPNPYPHPSFPTKPLPSQPHPSPHTKPHPSPHAKPYPSKPSSSPTKPKLPPSSHTNPASSHPKVSPAKSPSSQVGSAKQPPPLIRGATDKGKPSAAGMKTITVKLPPSLLGSAALPGGTSSATTTSALPNTSQIITVTLPPSLITNAAIPLLKTSSSIPLVKTTLTEPIVKATSTVPIAKRNATSNGDHSLSPPKPKKPKVMKTSLLPISRVRTIMKTNVQSSQPSLQLSQEAVLIIAKATELFISKLSQGAQEATLTNGNTVVGYNPLASSVQTTDSLHFLKDIVPKKVLVKDYLQQQNNT